jgi:hypothetical protein
MQCRSRACPAVRCSKCWQLSRQATAKRIRCPTAFRGRGGGRNCCRNGHRVAQPLDLFPRGLQRGLLWSLSGPPRHRRSQSVQCTLLRGPARVHHRGPVDPEPLRGLPLRTLPGQHADLDLVLLRRRQPAPLPPPVHGSIRHHNHSPIRSGTPDLGWDIEPRNVSRTQTQTICARSVRSSGPRSGARRLPSRSAS